MCASWCPSWCAPSPHVRFIVYCSPAGERHLRGCEWASSVQLVSHPLFGARGLKALTEMTLLGSLAGRRVDLLHSVALTAPLSTRAANVITIADTTWISGPHPDATTRLWRAIVPSIARRADRLIAISESSADQIVRDLGIARERIDVTLLGHGSRPAVDPLDAAAVRRRFSLSAGPIVLMVGTRKPHKNVGGLLSALPRVLAAQPNAQLVLVGNPTAHEPALRAIAQRLELGDHVSFLPFVEPAELEGLYAAAECFVLPSVNEGFGLPVLEAMGRGVPVACSTASALPEVAGDAALYFDPMRSDDIAAALIKLLGDPALRDRLRGRGRAREAELTWAATAVATLESYRRAWIPHRARPARQSGRSRIRRRGRGMLWAGRR